MSGWKLSNGELAIDNVDESELWRVCNYVFMGKSQKTNTYKFSLMKAIIDTACDAEITNNEKYFIDYELLFDAFTRNYWNLVLKYGLKQMRFNKRVKNTVVESIILREFIENEEHEYIEFDKYNDSRKKKVVYKVAKECRKYVLGALYSDTEGYIYGFDKNGEGIYLSNISCEFLNQNKEELNMINLMSWASFLEESNDDIFIKSIMSELELGFIIQDTYTMYNDILEYEFMKLNEDNVLCNKAYDMIIKRFLEESGVNRSNQIKSNSKIEKSSSVIEPTLNLEKIAISDDEIIKAREVLAINQKKLVVEDDNAEMCSKVLSIEDNDTNIQNESYSQIQKEILKCLACDNDVELKKIISENNISIAIEIDRINEIAMDELGDVLVDYDGFKYYIYEDYLDYVKEM